MILSCKRPADTHVLANAYAESVCGHCEVIVLCVWPTCDVSETSKQGPQVRRCTHETSRRLVLCEHLLPHTHLSVATPTKPKNSPNIVNRKRFLHDSSVFRARLLNSRYSQCLCNHFSQMDAWKTLETCSTNIDKTLVVASTHCPTG